MKENQVCHVSWMYIYTAYSIGSKSSTYRKSIVVARYIWKQMNVAKKTIRVVLTTKNYHCSQVVIGQLYIVSYRWLANSIMSTIITLKKCFRKNIHLSARLSLWQLLNIAPKPIDRYRWNSISGILCKYPGPFIFYFPLPLKLMIVHIRKEK